MTLEKQLIDAAARRRWYELVPGWMFTWHIGDRPFQWRCAWCGEKTPTFTLRDYRPPDYWQTIVHKDDCFLKLLAEYETKEKNNGSSS